MAGLVERFNEFTGPAVGCVKDTSSRLVWNCFWNCAFKIRALRIAREGPLLALLGNFGGCGGLVSIKGGWRVIYWVIYRPMDNARWYGNKTGSKPVKRQPLDPKLVCGLTLVSPLCRVYIPNYRLFLIGVPTLWDNTLLTYCHTPDATHDLPFFFHP